MNAWHCGQFSQLMVLALSTIDFAIHYALMLLKYGIKYFIAVYVKLIIIFVFSFEEKRETLFRMWMAIYLDCWLWQSNENVVKLLSYGIACAKPQKCKCSILKSEIFE